MVFNDESALKLQIPLPHPNLLVNSIDLYVLAWADPEGGGVPHEIYQRLGLVWIFDG